MRLDGQRAAPSDVKTSLTQSWVMDSGGRWDPWLRAAPAPVGSPPSLSMSGKSWLTCHVLSSQEKSLTDALGKGASGVLQEVTS